MFRTRNTEERRYLKIGPLMESDGNIIGRQVQNHKIGLWGEKANILALLYTWH